MSHLKVEVRDWMPENAILLAPKRRDHETDEEYQRRCGVIVNIAAVPPAGEGGGGKK
jgi:hypothetical protein